MVDKAEGDYPADGEVLFASGGFDAPSGVRDLNLLYGVLSTGQEAIIPDTGNPTLLVVSSGEISFGGSAGGLSFGEATALTGPISFRASSPGAIFYAAILGEEVPF